MLEIPVRWTFELQAIPNILEIIGSCNDPKCQNVLIEQTLLWIEKAQDSFSAKTISESPQACPNSKLTVSCRLIFKNEECLDDFLGYIASLYGIL